MNSIAVRWWVAGMLWVASLLAARPAAGDEEATLEEGLRWLSGDASAALLVKVDRRLPDDPPVGEIVVPEGVVPSELRARTRPCRAAAEEVLAVVPRALLAELPCLVLVLPGPRCAVVVGDTEGDGRFDEMARHLGRRQFLWTTDGAGRTPPAPRVLIERALVYAGWGWLQEARASLSEALTRKDGEPLTPADRVRAWLHLHRLFLIQGEAEPARRALAEARDLAAARKLTPVRPPRLDILDALVQAGEAETLEAVEDVLGPEVNAMDGPARGKHARAVVTLAWCLFLQGSECAPEAAALLDGLLQEDCDPVWWEIGNVLRQEVVRVIEEEDTAGIAEAVSAGAR